jgi:Resolvase, N terminal domain
VWKLDRLGRSLRHLVNVVHDLTSRGIGLRVLTGQGAAIDTTTPAGKLLLRSQSSSATSSPNVPALGLPLPVLAAARAVVDLR